MNQHDRCIVLAQRLLMIIFHHSDNLHRRISTFHCYQLAYRLIIGSKSQITYSCFINHQFIDIITIFFGETSSGYYLQTVCIRIIRITSQHLIKTVLLQSVIGATIGKECGHFFARHGTGKSNPMDQRKTRDCFFHCFQLDILPLCMSRKLNH